ncbi:MAG: hypothetical protein KME09_01785 [Pleurocapsa minor HA4230-MV1]|jgi:hypothetical protein|nr:hypothetical protein [Pleurocapsa minor HA4230-MV1]
MFDDVLKGAKAKKNKVEKVEEIESTVTSPAETKDIDEASTNTLNTPKRSKSTGKRTDPTYKQVGAYVKKDTYLQIQKLLLDKPDRDFSDLVQELLSTYLDNQLSN